MIEMKSISQYNDFRDQNDKVGFRDTGSSYECYDVEYYELYINKHTNKHTVVITPKKGFPKVLFFE